MKYIPGLDGIRALSAFAVIFFHLEIPFFGLGWTGVDCFFVLSGFLISGILIESKNSQNYFRNFYLKRSLRIFPIYYLLVLVVFLFFEYNLAFVKSILFYLTYTQNFFFVKVGYGTIPPLAHTWSLAIEEQFYLIWPLIIWKLSVKRIAQISLLLILVAFLFRTICSIIETNVYVQNSLLLSRMDGLAFGSLLSCLLRLEISKERIFNSAKLILLVLFSVGLLWSIYFSLNISGHFSVNGFFKGINKSMEVFSNKKLLREIPLWNFIFTMIALFYVSFIAFIIIDVKNSFSLAIRTVLETKLLRHLGKISYGLYLYHMPCFYLSSKLFVNESDSLLKISLIKVSFTYIISFLSWHLLESKMNNLKKQFYN